ncbi:MAG: response regulator transcription factor [Actinobacteria bacterium]|nr:response regulator transcription factor [Actinomycetota bacterium]
MNPTLDEARSPRSRFGARPEPPLVLVVEDDEAQRSTLITTLTAHGYRVRGAATGVEALDLAEATRPDLVLLDLGLPDVPGIELCRHLPLRHACPIVVVTGDDSDEQLVRALDLGADDYLVKPYNPQVLLARARVALRHRVATASLVDDDVLHSGDVTIDLAARSVFAGGTEVVLLPRQFEVLVALVRNPGRLLTYATLGRIVWGTDIEGGHHLQSLRTAVSRLRQALGEGPLRPVIETERHVGYRLVEPAGARPGS